MNKLPTKMRCAHILLSWDEAINSTHSRELPYAIFDAKEIIADLTTGRISWKVACKEHSACEESYWREGDLNWFEEHQITPEIWNACLITPIGDIHPEPVQSPYGIHIIYRTG
jgi:parvulin-like peptidyl-prolyl isomerase